MFVCWWWLQQQQQQYQQQQHGLFRNELKPKTPSESYIYVRMSQEGALSRGGGRRAG